MGLHQKAKEENMSPVLSPSKVEATSAERLPEFAGNDVVRIEFEIEDLVSRLAQIVSPDADGMIPACSGCSTCSA